MPRRTSEQAKQSRATILESAARLFRKKGYEGTGLDEMMRASGLTVGAFYAHFRSKSALFEEAFSHAAASSQALLIDRKAQGKTDIGAEKRFFESYLSEKHRDHVELGCPIAALGPDVARSGAGAKRALEALVQKLADSESLAALSLSVGAIILSRAVKSPELSDRILESARNAVNRMV